MVIKHNMTAENSARMNKIVSGKLTGSSEKLSSGYRINRAADDAAGLSISEKMRFQVRGLNRGSANIDEGIGYCQVADGALGEMHDMLQRINELCIQAANGTLSADDRKYIDDEVQALKEETDRICRTTKFNSEYIFRTEDKITDTPHDVYRLQFSGRPRDLFIYTDGLDSDSYAGVSFRGRRYAWDEIDANMYDKDQGVFREGEYSIGADDGTVLRLVCKGGEALPQVSRLFKTSANVKGIYVNNDLVEWGKVRQSGDTYSFDYHGMTISYTKNPEDTFDDMLLKMTGTVWESTYDTSVKSKALDAEFMFYNEGEQEEYKFKNNNMVAWLVEKIANKEPLIKYVIHAVDGNDPVNGKIRYPDGSEAPFDGIWIEGIDESGRVGSIYAKTWEELGFKCDTHGSSGCDWGNKCTGIWIGNDIKKDPDDVKSPTKYPAEASYPENTDFFDYDPNNEFKFLDQDGERVELIFSVLNEISKEQAIKALNNKKIEYGRVEKSINWIDPAIELLPTRISEASSGGVLTLSDEYKLGRDYENGQERYKFVKSKRQEYKGNGIFTIWYDYDPTRGGGEAKFTGSISSDISMAELEKRLITGGRLIDGDKLSASWTAIIGVSVTNEYDKESYFNIHYHYDVSDFCDGGGAAVSAIPTTDTEDVYVKKYNPDSNIWYYSEYNPDRDGGEQRYHVSITSQDGKTLEQYFEETVYKNIETIPVELETHDYPKAVLRPAADEEDVYVMVTRWKTPFQIKPEERRETVDEIPEYLRIQCSSNTVDNIAIQKQKLSVYRLGMKNVGTLSEIQATSCIDTVGRALEKLSSVRSLFGAYQNRLEHAYDINRNTHENTQGAESVIRDTDMADEMVRFANTNILQQAADAMLAQANQSSQGVMALLG